jgi:ring-1,2-phenylacetyl-CoA epoxidase subunit PaaD
VTAVALDLGTPSFTPTANPSPQGGGECVYGDAKSPSPLRGGVRGGGVAGEGSHPPLDQIWSWLGEIPDPEIPVISLVDLGIIRNVAWADDVLEVTVTPTYSGCPATSVINFEIDRHLRQRGISQLDLKRQLSPAWTTAWISAEGRTKLNAYGIAPPIEGTAACVGALRPFDVSCPRCGSKETERISQFGSTPCKASYRCTECLEPFDYFKSI